MALVVSVYSKAAFKEYILPSINNADYVITMRSNYFHIQEDLKIKLEILNGIWYLKKGLDYSVIWNNVQCDRQKLQDKEMLMLQSVYRDEISVIVKEIKSAFHVYQKFLFRDTACVTIGKEAHNDITYDYLGMVSRNHARILLKGDGCVIENSSPNGVYINSRQVNDSADLKFGDFINIMGLHIVFLGDILAIDMASGGIVVNEKVLQPYLPDGEATVFLENKMKQSSGQALYHRAPRNYEKLDSDIIEIEAPPVKNQLKRQPLFMSIGPSLTMALPMLLGCVMMLYSTNSAGGSTSLYMYSGLVMSVASASIGVVWTLVNLRFQKKEAKEQEAYRFQEYSNYLVEKTNEIKEKYNDTIRRLETTYPGADICTDYNKSKAFLWNRNHDHDDFLEHRLGIGTIPFQYDIQIPKRQFTLLKDELADKPAYIKENYQNLYDVPVTIDLLEKRLVGIVGGRHKSGAVEIVKILSAQIAANNCYTDVKLAYIYDNATSDDYGNWEFAKWFPHVWSEDKCTRFVAESKENASEVFYELTKIFRSRAESDFQGSSTSKKIIKPYYIVFLSDASILEGELFAKYALDGCEEYGLTTVVLAEQHGGLPNGCEFIIENTEQFRGMYDVYEGRGNRQQIVFDSVTRQSLEQFARQLASLRVSELEEGGEIPNSITFFEMFHINQINEYPVAEMWAKNRTYENIRGLLGQRAGGSPCYLDVHEKYHGPHGLIAGTTGSGKSETLQTYILSLAINYSPDDIAFFIIDYKGGGMANLFEGLPHMIGQISNLSGNQVRRAMISIKSENRRRQRVFTEHGVNNINLYTKLYKNGEAFMPIPHLFIIIDEFAELKREEPEFMQELISVAQVGRSLGVHLILATQKPSGTVDDNIWSNSKFRICLRVQDQQDSKDMLHKADAAYITQAGRGYLQIGNDEIYELFQSGFSGAVFDKNMAAETKETAKLITMPGRVDMTGNSVKLSQKRRAEEIWIGTLCKCLSKIIKQNLVGIRECADAESKINVLIPGMYRSLADMHIDYAENEFNSARLKDFISLFMEANRGGKTGTLPERIIRLSAVSGKKLPQAKEKTQLDVTKEYLAEIAAKNGYVHKIRLWMPLLGEHIYLDEFEEFRQGIYDFQNNVWNEQTDEWNLRVVIGRMDDPANQNQMPLIVDFAEQGHLAICGNVMSGKSTMMQTIVYGLIQKFSPEYINIYAIDFSSKMMSAFEEAPHTGGVMYEDDLDKISKFFNMMEKIISERKMLFKGGNYRQYIQLNGVTIPSIMVFVDNYAFFKEKTEGVYEEEMIQMSKEGISLGIYLIVSGTGFGYNDISNRIAENIETILCLSLQDKYAYGELLHNMQIDVLPETGVKGRGLAHYGTEILEYQTALAFEAENDYQRLDKIRIVCKEMKVHWNGKATKKIPVIPEKPTWRIFSALDSYRQAVGERSYVPVGYNRKSADICCISLKDIYCFLVLGGSRTGKTNFMRVMLLSVLDKKSKVCVLDSPKGEMRRYKKDSRVEYVSGDKEIFQYFRDTLTPVFQERNKIKNSLIREDFEENEIYETISRMELPYFIFISDMAWFVSMIYGSEFDMRGFMETILAKGRLHNIYFVAELSLNKLSGIRGYQLFETFAEYKTGIHFGGKVADNTLLSFDYMSFQEKSRMDPAGVGSLSGTGITADTGKVVIPLAKG